ncbi:MAG TPA: FtsX-like permease family protein, partial [Thermoanaerobaculia bacterium]|nr:FtsX-like permease family protein [Thermoanaerobaculia bacterium]
GHPSETFGDRLAVLTPLAEMRGFRGPGGARGTNTVVWLAGVAGLVLLIACANVANLQIARGIRRRRDLAVRMALGAGRATVVRQTLLESLVVAVVGAVAAGLALFWVGGLFRGMFLTDVPPPLAAEQLRLAGFLAAGALFAGLLSGLAPALQAGRRDLTVEIRAGAPEGSAHSSRLQGGLVAAQVALGLVLLVGTGLFVRSLSNAASLDLGFDAERVLVADIDLKGYDLSDEETATLYREMAERAESLPGIVRTALAEAPPLEHQFSLSISVPGREDFPELFDHGPYFHAVSESYFKTMGIELLRGSGFSGIGLRGGGPRLVVVNEAFAHRVWPGQDPLGKCLAIHEQNFCVTGVSENARQQGLIEEATAQVYLPMGHGPDFMGVAAMLARTAGDPAEVAPLLQRELQTLRDGLPYVRIRPLEQIVAPQLASWRMGARLFGLYGALALVLAILGTYGVMAYIVAQRTREMGVRIALGAHRERVVLAVLQQGLVVTAMGLAAGLGLVILGGRFLEPLLFQIGARDPAVLSAAAAVLGLSAALASYLPARRAGRVDPVVALRAE